MKFSTSVMGILVLIAYVLHCSCETTDDEVLADKKRLTGSKKWDKVAAAFRETIVRGFLQADAFLSKKLLLGHPLGVVTIWLLTIIESQTPEPSAWDKVQEKTEKLISERITDSRISLLQSVFNDIQSRLKKRKFGKTEKFTKQDLRFIRSQAPSFFPQTDQLNGAWTVKWPLALTKYMLLLATAYFDMMGEGVFNECKLGKVLDNFRPHMINAAKRLVKARYRTLEKVQSSGGQHALIYPTARLDFRDIADAPNDDRYVGVPLQNVKEQVLDNIKIRSSSFLFEHLISKFNMLYNESWVPKSCHVKGPISLKELKFPYEDECMGEYTYGSDSGTCTLPCGHYGGKFALSYNWCVRYPNNNIYENSWIDKGFFSETRRVFDCKVPTAEQWNSCMPTPRLPDIEWEAQDFDKKARKKKQE